MTLARGVNPLEVDRVIMGSLESPGRATIVGAGSPRDWDIRKGWGLAGATTVYTGENLQAFDIIVDLWDFPKHWAQWQIFSKILEKPLPGMRPLAIGIYHPAISSSPLGISEVVVLNVTQFEQVEDGLFSCRITCLPYKKPKPVLGKPLAAIPAVPKPSPTAQDAVELEIQRLQATAGALGTELAKFP